MPCPLLLRNVPTSASSFSPGKTDESGINKWWVELNWLRAVPSRHLVQLRLSSWCEIEPGVSGPDPHLQVFSNWTFRQGEPTANFGHKKRRWPHFNHTSLHRLIRGLHNYTFPRCTRRKKTSSSNDLALQHAKQDARGGYSPSRKWH